MNYKSVYFRVIRGEFLYFSFTTDCTEITDILTDFNSGNKHVPGVLRSYYFDVGAV